MDEVHLNDIGTDFIAEIVDGNPPTVVNVNGAGVIQIVFRKPDGTAVVKSASNTTDGTDGKIQYTSLVNVIDTLGIWSYQAYVELTATKKYRSSIHEFRVVDNLATS